MNSIKNFPYNNNGTVSEIPTLPTGTIIPYSTASAPDGYLSCNGAAISRETYKNLFTIIGTTYGEGDGSTTFNIPNLSNAVMPTSSNVAIKGNGMTTGFTDGQTNYGLIRRSDGGWNNNTDFITGTYGKPVGTTISGDYPPTKSYALTSDPLKSGIIGTLASTKMNFIIKY